MTYERQHCETCTCFHEKIEIDMEGIRLLNGATMPVCETCKGRLLFPVDYPGPRDDILLIGGKQYHDTRSCRP